MDESFQLHYLYNNYSMQMVLSLLLLSINTLSAQICTWMAFMQFIIWKQACYDLLGASYYDQETSLQFTFVKSLMLQVLNAYTLPGNEFLLGKS